MADRPGPAQEGVDTHFRRTASFWTDVYSGGRVEARVYQERRDRAARTVEQLGLAPGAKVLELGCGAGELAVRLARAGYAVTATDTVDAMLEQTARRAAEEDVRIEVRHADAHGLPFDDASFDLVVGLGVIPWLHSPERALAETARVLEPGGFALLSVDSARRLNELLDPWSTWVLAPVRARLRRRREERRGRSGVPSRRHRPRDLAALFASAGLDPVSGEAVGFGPFTFARRGMVPEPAGLVLNEKLQAWADRGVPFLRGGGVHYLALARKPR